jgi:hypothetical protein
MFLFGAFYQWISQVKHVVDKEYQLCANKGMLHPSTCQCCKHRFWSKLKLLLLFGIPSYIFYLRNCTVKILKRSCSVTRIIIIIIIIIISSSSLFTGFSWLFLLDQLWTPPLRLQVSDCSTFLIMCDVPSTAVFYRESIEFFPGIVYRYFCSPLVKIPGAPMIIGMTKHFMFHIRWISILKFLYFNLFSDSFCITFLSDGIATAISKQTLSFLF